MNLVELIHPKLDRSTFVQPSAVPVLLKSGWQVAQAEAADDEESFQPEHHAIDDTEELF